MSDFQLERRVNPPPCWDAPLVMGVMYTLVYAGMVASVVFIDIPDGNASTINNLVGAMTVIQTAITGYFFGSSKSAQDSQRLIAVSKERTDSVLRGVVASTAVAPGAIRADDVNVQAAGNVTVEGVK